MTARDQKEVSGSIWRVLSHRWKMLTCAWLKIVEKTLMREWVSRTGKAIEGTIQAGWRGLWVLCPGLAWPPGPSQTFTGLCPRSFMSPLPPQEALGLHKRALLSPGPAAGGALSPYLFSSVHLSTLFSSPCFPFCSGTKGLLSWVFLWISALSLHVGRPVNMCRGEDWFPHW